MDETEVGGNVREAELHRSAHDERRRAHDPGHSPFEGSIPCWNLSGTELVAHNARVLDRLSKLGVSHRAAMFDRGGRLIDPLSAEGMEILDRLGGIRTVGPRRQLDVAVLVLLLAVVVPPALGLALVLQGAF